MDISLLSRHLKFIEILYFEVCVQSIWKNDNIRNHVHSNLCAIKLILGCCFLDLLSVVFVIMVDHLVRLRDEFRSRSR